MTNEECFTILGISSRATEEDVKRAFRVLSKKYHPDISDLPDANERFVRVKLAYEHLLSRASRTKPNATSGAYKIYRILENGNLKKTRLSIPAGMCAENDVIITCMNDFYGTFRIVLRKGTEFPHEIAITNLQSPLIITFNEV